jgi:hypothetical protein
MLRSLSGGIPVAVTVTLLDGLVLARSAFHHSMNYRSAVLLGTASLVEAAEEKGRVLDAIVEHIIPGRGAEARRANDNELKATSVLALKIEEGSAKLRSGPPIDDAEDMGLPVWAGVLPLRLAAGEPVADAALAAGSPVPSYVSGYRRPGKT